jgi:hypothetical protein
MFTGRIAVHKNHITPDYTINGNSMRVVAKETQTCIYEQEPDEWSKYQPWFMIMSPDQTAVIDAINKIQSVSNYMEFVNPSWHPPLYSWDEKRINEYFGEDILDEIESCHEYNASLTDFERQVEDSDLETSAIVINNIIESMDQSKLIYNDPFITDNEITEEEKDLIDTLIWNHWSTLV